MKITKECINENGTPLTKEEFIDKIKVDEEFAKRWGDLGPIYGKQWRDWGGHKEFVEEGGYHYGGSFGGHVHTVSGKIVEKYVNGIDQIANVINDLKTNPDSRRLMVNAWNVEQIPEMTLPPCHYGFQFYTRELSFEERIKYCNKNHNILLGGFPEESYQLDEVFNVPKRAISLKWDQRSVDTFLGLPFNIASYALLLEIVAKEVNMIPEELIGNLGDTHLYLNHIDQAKEQITRSSYKLPKLNIKLHFKNNPSFTPEYWLADDFQIENYQAHPSIKAPLSN